MRASAPFAPPLHPMPAAKPRAYVTRCTHLVSPHTDTFPVPTSADHLRDSCVPHVPRIVQRMLDEQSWLSPRPALTCLDGIVSLDDARVADRFAHVLQRRGVAMGMHAPPGQHPLVHIVDARAYPSAVHVRVVDPHASDVAHGDDDGAAARRVDDRAWRAALPSLPASALHVHRHPFPAALHVRETVATDATDRDEGLLPPSPSRRFSKAMAFVLLLFLDVACNDPSSIARDHLDRLRGAVVRKYVGIESEAELDYRLLLYARSVLHAGACAVDDAAALRVPTKWM